MITFMSVEEAARIFETSPQTIRTWIAEGKLRTAPRLGRRHRIFVESVAEQSGLSGDQVRGMIELYRSEERAINKPGALIAA